jgi:hypothetical protein
MFHFLVFSLVYFFNILCFCCRDILPLVKFIPICVCVHMCICTCTYIYNIYICNCRNDVLTQGLILAKHVLSHLSPTHPFCFSHFLNRVLCFCQERPGLSSYLRLPWSWDDRHMPTLLAYCLRWVSLTFACVGFGLQSSWSLPSK